MTRVMIRVQVIYVNKIICTGIPDCDMESTNVLSEIRFLRIMSNLF